MSGTRPLRVVVWSSGGVGSIAIRAVSCRLDLELVGVWVHSPAKAGKDAGTLAGIRPVGVKATHDAQSLIDLKPDCVVYGASSSARDAAAVPDYVRLLEAGINVVSTTSTGLIYPSVYDALARARLEAAASSGGASLYVSGIFPGFASDQLALLMATQSLSIRSIKTSEVSLNDHYPVASVMMDGLGFGRPLDFIPDIGRPGAIEHSWRAPIHLMAAALGLEIETVRGVLDRELTHRPLEVAFGTIPANSCGAVRTRAIGIAKGREAIVIEHVIRMARDVAPAWPHSESDATYRVSIEGDPDIRCSMTMGPPEGHAAGNAAMTGTTMRVVNAIPYVVAARPGLLSQLDLPMTLPRHVFEKPAGGP